RSLGVVEIDTDLLVKKFIEKPQNPPSMPDDATQALASMGIYVFNVSFLLKILAQEHSATVPRDDFGKHILPEIVGTHTVGAYRFCGNGGRVTPDGYWQDIGTLDA